MVGQRFCSWLVSLSLCSSSLEMEAEPGIEPGYTDLQSAASPLCHPANFKATHFRCIWILNQVQKVLTLSVSTKKGCGDSLFGEVLR